MQNLYRNLFTIYYKLYTGETEIVDSYGNKTGSFTPSYGALKSAKVYVSPNRGIVQEEIFGTFENYDRVISTADTGCDIDENAILWIDGAPTSGAHNYVVTRRSQWKNSISFAIKKVDVK